MMNALASLDEAALIAEMKRMTPEKLARLEWRLRWAATRHEHQTAPPGDWWTIWLLLAGRGAGKTRTAAETLAEFADQNPGSRCLVAAPTYGDLVGTCFDGESGLLNVIPKDLIQPTSTGSLWNKSDAILTLKNDTIIRGISAENPERFRGGNYHFAWADELASWLRLKDAMDNMMFSLRLGTRPRLIVTTTPKPRAEIRSLIAREGKDVVVTRASTYANLKNLAPTFRDQILQYEGTQLGRQEIHAEVLDPEEQGIIRRSWFQLWPSDKPLPQFRFVIVSLDTAFTEATRDKKTGDNDPTACEVWGLFDHNGKPGIMLLDCWADHLGMPDLLERVPKEMGQHYGKGDGPIHKHPQLPSVVTRTQGRRPDLLLIEDKGSGISLRQMLAKEGIHAYPYNPGKASKVERLHAVSHLFASGHIWVVESETKKGSPKTWADPLISQVCSFSGEGSTDHDDYVDAATQAIRYMADRNMITVRPIEVRTTQPAAPRKPVKNPYAV